MKRLVDTHCHINTMVKDTFDTPLMPSMLKQAAEIIHQAAQHHVTHIINVGTSLIESNNSVALAKSFDHVYASVGIHPNDCSAHWKEDFKAIERMVTKREAGIIVGIGETGLDKHYEGYHLQRQIDAFKAHIELALTHNLALVVHSRDAADETLSVLQNYRKESLRGVIHCFSEDQSFAQEAINLGFVLGMGGTITYPKNELLRMVCSLVDLSHIVLETDAPFLPPQIIRGKQNHPKYIATIAEYLAELRGITVEEIARITTTNVQRVFDITI